MILVNPVSLLDSVPVGISLTCPLQNNLICLHIWLMGRVHIRIAFATKMIFEKNYNSISHLLLGRCHKFFLSPISHLGDGPKIYYLPSPLSPLSICCLPSPTGRYRKFFPSPISHLGDWQNRCHLPSPQPLSPPVYCYR